MPTDVKAVVSVIVIVLAIGLVSWNGSPIQPDFDRFVIFTSIFFVVAMWIFPEAGVKKGMVKKR